MGFPKWFYAQLGRLQLGNDTFCLSCRIISLCSSLGAPFLLENSQTSIMWHARLARPVGDVSCASAVGHLCPFGARRRKATRVAGWHVSCFDCIKKGCGGRRGICSRSGRCHIALSGAAPGGRRWNAIAAEYPKLFASTLAPLLRSAPRCEAWPASQNIMSCALRLFP